MPQDTDVFNFGAPAAEQPDPTDVLKKIGTQALASGQISKADAKKMKKDMGGQDPGDFLSKYLMGPQKDPYQFGSPLSPAMGMPGGQMVASNSPMDAAPAPSPGADLSMGDEEGPAASNNHTQTKTSKNINMSQSDIANAAAGFRALPEFQASQQGLQGLEDQVNMLKGMKGPNDAWVKPLLALADSQRPGSHLVSGYDDSNSQKRNETLLKYQDEIQKRKQEMAKSILEGVGKTKEGTQQTIIGMPTNGYGEARISNAITNAGKDFDKDPLMIQYTRTGQNLDRAVSMMNGKTPITGKNFALLQQDMINAMAPGGAATEGKVNREMVETLAAQLNDIGQKFGNISDLRKEQPQIFAQLQGLIKQVHSDYASAAKERINDIHENHKLSPIDEVRETSNNKVKTLLTRWDKHSEKAAPAPSKPGKKLEDMSDEEIDALHSKLPRKGG